MIPSEFWNFTPRELEHILQALDDRWRKVKELVAWNAYHAGTLPHMKSRPSFARFMRALVPRRFPTKRELGRKIENIHRQLVAHWRTKGEDKCQAER